MSSSSMRSLEGFISVGTETPFLNPNEVVIVGLDVPETSDNWYAHCARLKDTSDADLADYLDEVRTKGQVALLAHMVHVSRDGNRAVVLEGRRTTRVARMRWAEQEAEGVPEKDRVKIRATFHRGTPDELYHINVASHKRVPLTKTQEARSVLTYWQNHAEDSAATAEFFGITTAAVRYQLAIAADISPKLQHAVDAGEFPVKEAARLASLPRAEQDAAYEQFKAAGATKGAAAANAVRSVKRGERVNQADKTRGLPRPLVMRWRDEVKKLPGKARCDLAPILDFLLGGPLPTLDEHIAGTLVAAGYKVKKEKVEKPPKVKKEKAEKSPKTERPKAEKKPKKAKVESSKKGRR